jgi:hypothetical protein
LTVCRGDGDGIDGEEGGEGERGGKDEERGGEDEVADRGREGPKDVKRAGEGRGERPAVLRFLMLNGLIVGEVGVAGGPLEVGLEHSEWMCECEVEVESMLECGECE